MSLIIISQSRMFEGYISSIVDEFSVRSKLSAVNIAAGDVILVHAASFADGLADWLMSISEVDVVVGIAADNPKVEDMLAYTELGVRGFFNSYMSKPHYDQLLRLLANGQSWFPPILMAETFDLARSAIQQPAVVDPLDGLTKREKEVALAVAGGQSNKLVASNCNMAERTVKTHLTQIFKKLQLKDRVALVIYLNQFDLPKLKSSITG